MLKECQSCLLIENSDVSEELRIFPNVKRVKLELNNTLQIVVPADCSSANSPPWYDEAHHLFAFSLNQQKQIPNNLEFCESAKNWCSVSALDLMLENCLFARKGLEIDRRREKFSLLKCVKWPHKDSL